MSREWLADEKQVRAALGGETFTQPVSVSRLHDLGYELPGWADAQAADAARARDELFLSRLPAAPESEAS